MAISLFLLLFFHFPFFRTIASNVEPGANGVLIFCSMVLLMFLLNFLVFFLLLNLCGKVGKFVVSFFLVGNSIGLYFLNVFNALIDDRMMGNVLNTNMDEAGSFYTPWFVVYVLFLGVLPTALLWWTRLRRVDVRRSLSLVGLSLGLIGATMGVNSGNFLWIDRNVPVFGSQILPWSYVINTFRYLGAQKRKNVKEITLPDAQVRDSSRSALVLVIGESARRENFQLYGYPKATNPRLSQRSGLHLYKADAAAANTIDAVRAIVTRQDEKQLHEILPNYMERSGADVLWNTSNWGEPPLHIKNVFKRAEIAARTGSDPEYDSVLFEGVKEFIDTSACDKVLVVVHGYTSHGPAYFSNYPPEFEVFTPACKTVEVTKCPREELINAYDNTIVYTDYLLDEMISQLEAVSDRKCALIFLSDHGESLGEGGSYMHGTGLGSPDSKPQEYQVPFIVWTNATGVEFREDESLNQHFVFHSVMDFLGFEGGAFDPSMSVFRR